MHHALTCSLRRRKKAEENAAGKVNAVVKFVEQVKVAMLLMTE